MNEVNANICFSMSKRSLLDLSMGETLTSSCVELGYTIKEQFIDMLIANLKDEENAYQITLNVKPLDKEKLNE